MNFFDKIVFRVAPGGTDEEQEELSSDIKKFIGSDAETVLVLEDDLDETGEVKENGSFRIDKIESNVNDKLFEKWEKSLANNIRKAAKGVPAILIDYEQSNLGNTSGESVRAAVEYYNAITLDDRKAISKSFAEFFKNFNIPELANNTNWTIKPLELISNVNNISNIENVSEAERIKTESQTGLRGSVGGVQGILQIQQSVSKQLTDYSAAVIILQEIFGFSEEIAKKILGTPIIEKNGTNNIQPTTTN